MISYRALKKLIGETSLERKCRFLFGIALLVLITTSFWLYESRTRSLIETQQVIAARMLVPRLLNQRHLDRFLTLSQAAASGGPSNTPPTEAAPPESGDAALTVVPPAIAQREFNVALDKSAFDPQSTKSTKWYIRSLHGQLPDSDQGFEARRRFLDPASGENEYWVITEEEGKPRHMSYFAAIRNEEACRRCHGLDGSVRPDALTLSAEWLTAVTAQSSEAGRGSARDAAPPDSDESTAVTAPLDSRLPLIGVAEINISLELVDAQLSRNRAILLATGIVTAFLAMLVAWVIVRYVIVKPVLHLKDVSDEIARGNLNLRAEISTGDEFEELSHAFNRMLRHMMTVNDELRTLNVSLDGKIDQLAQANMELFSNNKLKDDFLATISHELRTPLNSILGFSDILQSAPNLDERQKRFVGNIQSSGQTLMLQINDLLDLAKIESGKMDLHLSDVQLADIIDAQVQQIAPLADRKNIDLRVDAPLEPLPMLLQDRGKIMQILTNLLSNAVKFTPEGGRIRVSSRIADDEFVEFSVEDTGIGIPLQEQEHIFEKFRQGSTVPGGRDHVKREYEGTGLGLSIVRELARLLGGDVLLRSEFGRGSLFTVRLPLIAPDRRRNEQLPQLESRSNAGQPLITTVDLRRRDTETPPKTPARAIEVHSI